MQKKFLLTAAAVLLMSIAGGVFAASPSWTGDFSTDLMNKYNWSTQAAPIPGDSLTIIAGSYYDPIYAAGVNNDVMVATVEASGMMTISSGRLRLTGTSDTSLTVRGNRPGVLVTGGELFCSKNVYLGRNNDNAMITVTGGKFTVGSAGVMTVGYQSTSAVLNIWGGEVDLGNGLRIAHQGGSGTIDIRSPGTAKVNVGATTIDLVRGWITSGNIVSQAGYEPNAIEFIDTTDANTPSILIRALPVYYAAGPSPAVGAHRTAQNGQVLSWVNPLPRNPGDTVTSNVYFGTNTNPSTMIASNYSGASIQVNTLPETTYYWRIDSRDSNGGSPIVTTGNVWNFDTKITPTVSVGYSGRQAALRVSDSPSDVNAVAVLVASASDDGYPSPLTYSWSAGDNDPNVTFSDRNALNPTATFNTPTKDYPLTLTVFDGSQAASATVTVRVFASTDYCNAAKFPTNFAALTGDMNTDCVVDGKDLATLAAQWLECNSLDCQ